MEKKLGIRENFLSRKNSENNICIWEKLWSCKNNIKDVSKNLWNWKNGVKNYSLR